MARSRSVARPAATRAFSTAAKATFSRSTLVGLL
jgi:hypothetical protein